MDQSRIMETMQEVANRKTSAADPWKGMVEVEELDIDRALQSHAHVLIDLVRDSPKKVAEAAQQNSEDAALKSFNSQVNKVDTVDLLQVDDNPGKNILEKSALSTEPRAPHNDMTIAPEGLSLVEAALANYSRNLWEYYVSGLKQKNDAALSVFAPPLVFGKVFSLSLFLYCFIFMIVISSKQHVLVK
jgi:hypothetical protein